MNVHALRFLAAWCCMCLAKVAAHATTAYKLGNTTVNIVVSGRGGGLILLT